MASKNEKKENADRQAPKASTQKSYQEPSSQIEQRGNRTRRTQEENDEEPLNPGISRDKSSTMGNQLSSKKSFQEKAEAARSPWGSRNTKEEDVPGEDEEEEIPDEEEDEDYDDDDEDYDDEDDEDTDEDEEEESSYSDPSQFTSNRGRGDYQLTSEKTYRQQYENRSGVFKPSQESDEEGGRMNNLSTSRQAYEASQQQDQKPSQPKRKSSQGKK